jgi:choline dehydrogenase-like flavoprotein
MNQAPQKIESDAFDVCVVGSGAGGGPVALSLSRAGYRVVVLEKGPFFHEPHFSKDEILCCRRDTFKSDLRQEPHVVETKTSRGSFAHWPTHETGWNFWNGNCVGGASNFMSGFFHRLKPRDFKLLSAFGPVKGANVADWPISYEDLEPWYTLVEEEVGVSGKATAHPFAEPRSRPDFPMPPTAEHPLAQWVDHTCEKLGLHAFPVPRAILSLPRPQEGRRSCEYSGFCGSYGCTSGAKGSARVSVIEKALGTGRCTLLPRHMVHRLISNERGRVEKAEVRNAQGQVIHIRARIFVVACQAIESARLLLSSTGPKHPRGLGNSHDQVGKNLLFTAAGSGNGIFHPKKFSEDKAAQLQSPSPFVNRAIQDFYTLDPDQAHAQKGGTIDFLLRHPNAIRAGLAQTRRGDEIVWGKKLKKRIRHYFQDEVHLIFEAFCDWMTNDNTQVRLDPTVKDQWGMPAARVKIDIHPKNKEVATRLAKEGRKVLEAMGAEEITTRQTGGPATNLVGGTCRFGTNPEKSVLDKDCRAHDCDNLFVTDASFMPTGGSVPFTWTVYANSFRVAEKIKDQLGGAGAGSS